MEKHSTAREILGMICHVRKNSDIRADDMELLSRLDERFDELQSLVEQARAERDLIGNECQRLRSSITYMADTIGSSVEQMKRQSALMLEARFPRTEGR
jgi:hypothetical protein